LEDATVYVKRTIGTYAPHELEVGYWPWLRLISVRLNGRVAYWHCARIPGATRRAKDFKSAGPEVRFYFVEPPGFIDPHTSEVQQGYTLWLDGKRFLSCGLASSPQFLDDSVEAYRPEI
jgi:hypothetical protein